MAYLKTKSELNFLPAKRLAAYLRNEFKINADWKEGKAVLFDRALHLHEVNNLPLSDEAPPRKRKAQPSAPIVAAQHQPAPQAPAPQPSGVEAAAGAFLDAVLRKAGEQTDDEQENEDELWPLEPNEKRAGQLRVTAIGNFPEAARYPALRTFTRERDRRDFMYFRSAPSEKYPAGRRLMLGVTCVVNTQVDQPPYVHVIVQGLAFTVQRGVRLGIPLPHFQQIQQARDVRPGYQETGKIGEPKKEFMVPTQTYSIQNLGECLCDPTNGEVVEVLTRFEMVEHSMEPVEIQRTLA